MQIGILQFSETPTEGGKKGLNDLSRHWRAHLEGRAAARHGKVLKQELRRLTGPQKRLTYPSRFGGERGGSSGVAGESGYKLQQAADDIEDGSRRLAAHNERSSEAFKHLKPDSREARLPNLKAVRPTEET